MTHRIRLGTRGSMLAQWQANWVAARLRETGVEVEIVPIVTSGDESQAAIDQGPPDPNLPAIGIFTKEIQRELLAGRIDLAVHSLKDLPTDRVPGLVLAAVPERGPVNDAFVSDRYGSRDKLPQNAVVGTGSLRRRAQLLWWRPDLQMHDIRGNVDTRLRKLRDGRFDAIVLAVAGLSRLGLEDRITETLSRDIILPAVGQGALGLETREDDGTTRHAIAALNCPVSHAAVRAERAMLAALDGGCLAPIGGFASAAKERLELTGRVLAVDGSRRIEADAAGNLDEPESLGQRVAASLLKQGAAELIAAARFPE